MKNSIFTLILVVFASLVLTACQSKEEKAISQVHDIAEQIHKQGDKMSSEEWDELIKEYEALHEELSNGEYNFNEDQLAELAKAEGEVVGAICEQGGKEIGKAFKNVIDMGSGFLKGLTGED